MGARPPRRRTTRDWWRAAARADHLVCAGLFACGGVYAWFNVSNELRYHVLVDPTRQALTGFALLCGIVLGFLLPRRIIQRRLERPLAPTSSPLNTSLSAAGGAQLEFAAVFTGGLLLVFGLLCVALSIGIGGLEDYRAFLVLRFTFPPGLILALLLTPLLLVVFLMGVWTSVVLSALHGWHRLARQPEPRVSRLWAAFLIGGLLAASSTRGLPFATWLTVAAPLAVLLASIIAVWRRRPALGATPPASSWNWPTRTEIVDLLTVCLATLLVSAASLLGSPDRGFASQSNAWIALLLGGLTGWFLASRIRRSWPEAASKPYFILLGALSLLFPYSRLGADPFTSDFARLFLVAAAAGGTIQIIAREWAQPCQRIQRTLSWLGVAAAAGVGLTLIVGLWVESNAARLAWAMLITIVGVCSAAYYLLPRFQPYGRPRLIALLLAGVWLLVLPWARHVALSSRVKPSAGFVPPPVSFRDEARRLVSAEMFSIESIVPLPPGNTPQDAWNIDLAGPPLDLVILDSTSAEENTLTPKEARRLLERASRRLARGGRLLVELPNADGLQRALRQWIRLNASRSPSTYELTLRDASGKFAALAVGGDIPELIERNRRFCPLDVELHPLPAPLDNREQNP